MIIAIVLVAFYRYYALQREAFNKVLTQLRDDLSADAQAVYKLAYDAGVNTRLYYEEYSPKAIDLVSGLRARFFSTED